MKSQFLKSLALDLTALGVGAYLWYDAFGAGFMGSYWAWVFVGVQSVGAFAVGWASRRWFAEESHFHRGLRIVLYEIGHICMWIWAGANFYANGVVEFGIGFYLMPLLADVFVWWLAVRRRSSQ